LFCSVHLKSSGADSFFPGTGSLSGNLIRLMISIENTLRDSPDFPGGIFNLPYEPSKLTSDAWRKAFTT
jgi:hypothetical protein